MNDRFDGHDEEQDKAAHPDIDPGVALHMKLGGAGAPVEPDYAESTGAAAEPVRERISGTRLCPGCNRVVEFREGVCPECSFEFQSAHVTPPAFEAAVVDRAEAGGQLLKIVMIVALVAVLGFVISRVDFSFLSSDKGQGSTTDTGIVEPFIAIQIDDDFRHTLAEQLTANAEAWTATGVDAYVYRFGVREMLEPGVSQRIVISAYVGGGEADAAIVAPADQPFRLAMADYVRSYSDKQGLTFSIDLLSTGGEAEINSDDQYVRWGYYYGREHLAELQQVADAIEKYRSREGELPRSLSSVSANMHLEHRGFAFIPGGWGYLPVFEADSSGTVPFGTGSKAELYPRKITGYYLVRYLSSTDFGVDIWSDEEKTYYLNRITPLPCVQKGKLHNATFTPDGKADGVACLMHNGELVHN
jgi:hypothetical protein